MKFIFITLFPEQIEAAGRYSMIKRGLDAGLLELECVNPRDFSRDKHRSVDDTPFGGGVGSVRALDPFRDCCGAVGGLRGGLGRRRLRCLDGVLAGLGLIGRCGRIMRFAGGRAGGGIG